jgi:hypothetical protein
MGQMTQAVLFGVRMRAPEGLGDEGWWSLVERYVQRDNADGMRPDKPSGDATFDGVGFWCAVGASGEDGVPDMPDWFALDEGADGFAAAGPEYEEALRKAREAWVRFSTWCSEQRSGGKGKRAWTTPAVSFPEPRLYLVSTEVA